MRISVVTYHLPHPDGTAAGRHVFAVWDAVREMGHDVEAWCWGEPPVGLRPPDWVRCSRYHDPGGWRELARTIRRPRRGIAEVQWTPPGDAVAWAEDPESYAAITQASRRGLSVLHSSVLDAVALRQPRAAVVQSARAERWAVRHAGVAIAFSPRVARAIRIRELCPVAVPIPAEPLPLVDEPTALMLADWAWRPNQVALERLLQAWPLVRREVPDARLMLAGRGLATAPTTVGVETIGVVSQARDALALAAVFAFPCPPTSGPKMKVLDALAHGVPVVTSHAGVEGLTGVGDAVAVAADRDFVRTLADLLRDPQRRAVLAANGRRAVLDHHTPAQAAATRLLLIEQQLV